MGMQRHEIINEQELAKELRVSLRHVTNLRARKLLPFLRLGRAIRYDRAAVERALAKLETKELA